MLLTAAFLGLQIWVPSAAVPVVAAAHLVLCGADLLVVGILVTRVPAGAVLRNQGFKTHWRMPGPAGTSSSAAQSPVTR